MRRLARFWVYHRTQFGVGSAAPATRLKEQEHLLHDVSQGYFQLPPTLTENIMREIATHQTYITFRKQALDTVGTLIRVNLFDYSDGRDGTSGVIAFPATL